MATTTTRWHELADRILDGGAIDATEALAVLDSSDAELMEVVAAASRLRFEHFGNKVKVNYLVNLKSGLCPEDCFYCSQRLNSTAGILRYTWLNTDEAVTAAKAGIAAGASRVCLVASGTGPSNREVGKVSDIIEAIKSDTPGVEVCACLGALKDGQAEKLCASGADAYNHNLNTAESHYEEICTTHTYADREHTVSQAHGAGLSACSGFIAGMGETREQLVELAFDLRAKGVDSIPVNFLLPFDGTPLEGVDTLNPRDCLRILAMVRFVAPDTEIRMAAGRERHLGYLQGMGLYVANSLFLGDYLTSEGQPGGEDLQMIADAGLEVLQREDAAGAGEVTHAAAPVTAPAAPATQEKKVAIRTRGAGTSEPANA
ncbi:MULTISPECIES: biotin synthase BioB [unclassified Dietzia]|uniref:biotin synthase BioB n=1 Tax=unclassified Dietzia TaxID=2617939 RepID=UPI0015FA2F71|nr:MULTISPECIES: biotin synthase BioB [unclassified Dietzia]MBB1024949.1 biotin synthase BioB [Dietzia sp. DQ12-76]MBB1028581.1 biotin synthase BioB [Dietzia sp. DQ11-38-2]